VKSCFLSIPLATVLLSALLGSPLRAAEEATPAIKLIKLMDFATNAKVQAMATMTPMLEQLRKQGLPDEAIKEVTAAAEGFFQKTFDDPEITVEMAKVYEKEYTSEEINQLLAFYETPIGRKSLTVLPRIMAQSNKVGNDFAMKNQADFQKQVMAVISKYKASAGTPAPTE